MKRIKKILIDVFIKASPLLTRIIPKRKGLIVFVPVHSDWRFSGNIKGLLLYIKKYHPKITCKVVGITPNYLKQIQEYKVEGILNRFLAHWAMLRAQYLIVDATAFTRLPKGKYAIIQLWHGTGFKNIGLLNTNLSDEYKSDLKTHYKKYQLVVATSEDDRKRKNASFGTDNACITGSPRNDIFFEEKTHLQSIANKILDRTYSKVIVYAPTFRDFETFSPFTESFWPQLNNLLKEKDAIFIIKKHPWDKHLRIPTEYSNIKDLSLEVMDVQELLLIADLLITDYSGIVTDFVLTDRPVVLYMYDYQVYKSNCRSLYYDLEEILPKPFVYDEGALLERLKNDEWMGEEEYLRSYQKFKKRFHQYEDGNSSKRVFERIMKL